MTITTKLAALALYAGASVARAAVVEFEDDRGVTHSWDNSKKATVGVRAGVGGLSLHQLGMQKDQLKAYWGLWGIRGSDFDPEDPGAGSIYPEADPTEDEADFFSEGVNMSPGCWQNPRGCFRWDAELDDDVRLMANSSQVDFIVYIDNGNDSQMKKFDEDSGSKVVFVDTFYDKHPECRAANFTLIDETKCYGRSMIDIAARIEELAIFLGVDVDVPAQEAAKQEACAAAAAFTESMEAAHEKDLRIKVSILGSTERDGLQVPYARDFDPIQLWVPRTLEELGAPLLHAKAYNSTAGESRHITPDEFFPDCSPGLINETCKDNTYHPVDFWLIDSRSYLVLEDWLDLDLYPDPAILAGQFSYYPRNDGAISFKMITSLLTLYNDKISAATKVSKSDPGTCTNVDPKSSEIISRNAGLDLNDFICYDKGLIQEEYLKCPPAPETGTADPAPADPAPADPAPADPAPADPAPSGCYSGQPDHKCFCDAANCDGAKCGANGFAWTERCAASAAGPCDCADFDAADAAPAPDPPADPAPTPPTDSDPTDAEADDAATLSSGAGRASRILALSAAAAGGFLSSSV